MKYLWSFLAIVGLIGLVKIKLSSKNKVLYRGVLNSVSKTHDATTFTFADGKQFTLPVNNDIEYTSGTKLSLVDWGHGSQQMILDME